MRSKQYLQNKQRLECPQGIKIFLKISRQISDKQTSKKSPVYCDISTIITGDSMEQVLYLMFRFVFAQMFDDE